MSGEPNICVFGNLAGEGSLRYTPTGMPVLDFTIAQTPSVKDRNTDQWVDGETQWYRITCFKKLAENTAESLAKGVRVIATGRLTLEKWTDKSGAERTTTKILADEIGISTKWHTVKAAKAERSSQAPPTKPSDDPWAPASADDDAPF